MYMIDQIITQMPGRDNERKSRSGDACALNNRLRNAILKETKHEERNQE